MQTGRWRGTAAARERGNNKPSHKKAFAICLQQNEGERRYKMVEEKIFQDTSDRLGPAGFLRHIDIIVWFWRKMLTRKKLASMYKERISLSSRIHTHTHTHGEREKKKKGTIQIQFRLIASFAIKMLMLRQNTHDAEVVEVAAVEAVVAGVAVVVLVAAAAVVDRWEEGTRNR